MKIEKLSLLTNDIKQTKLFYSDRLNLEIVKEESDSVSFAAGITILSFSLTSIPNPSYHFAFNISNNKIEEAAQWCEQRQLSLLPFEGDKIIDFPNWNAKSIYFLDSNGNILEFIARFDLKNTNDSPFSEKHILNVSEIGMVVDDVLDFCNNTTEEYGIPVYEKQKRAPSFSVMGDAHGLFIVVPEKRIWFPTTILSGKFPLKIVLEQNGTVYEISA